jgi:choline-sulfatase
MASAARNVVVVMTDDHGQWCSGAYGNAAVATPTLDHLADTGVRFENAFCPSPVCSPARASFWTGRRPSQHGVHDYIDEDRDPDPGRWLADEVTLPELLGEAGYTTGMAGKYHCGRGHEEAVFDWTANMHAEGWPVEKFSVERDRRIVDHATQFLRERAGAAPFFLYVGLTATHGPWAGEPERLVERHRGNAFADVPEDETYRFGRSDVIDLEDPDEALAQYYAAVEGVDANVGRLVDELDALGVGDETLVVYTADHGHNCGHHGLWGKGNGTAPQNVLEESIRVPLVVAGTDDLVTPQVRAEFVDHCDTFRTLLDCAGVDAPDRNYPGQSYWGQLVRAEGSTDREQLQICEYADVRMARSERYKLVRRLPDGPDLLFNLVADPRETRNVVDDPAHADARERLAAALDDAFETYVEEGSAGVPVEALPTYNRHQAWERDG